MSKKDDKEMTITGRTPHWPAGPFDFNRNGRVRELVAKPTLIAASYKQLDERAAAGLLARFKEAFPEIDTFMAKVRSTERPPTHAFKPASTDAVLCEDPEARYATPWPTPPLAPNGPVTCIACLHIITRDRK